MNNIIYSDVDVSFDKNPTTNDVLKKTNVADIRQSLKLLIKTSFYSRLWNPDIGNNLKRLLFSQNDSFTRLQIKQEIERLIKTYEPRVRLIDLQIEQNSNNVAQVDAKITYEIVNLGLHDTYIYHLTKLR